MRRLVAEFLGTFSIVLMGIGAIIVNQIAEGQVTHVGISLAFGLVVMAMIFAMGRISGAHFNPAVSLAFWASGRLSVRWLPGYIVAQIFGAITACVLLKAVFWDQTALGGTFPQGTEFQSFVLEALFTFVLMLTVMCVADGSNLTSTNAGVAVGAIIALETLVGGPISGASMNPARSLAPALVSMKLQHLWIYLSGPILGALLAVPFGTFLSSGDHDRT